MKALVFIATFFLVLSSAIAQEYSFCTVKIGEESPFTYIVVSCDGRIIRGETIKSNKAASTFTSEVSKLLKSQPGLRVVSCGYTSSENESDAPFCHLSR